MSWQPVHDTWKKRPRRFCAIHSDDQLRRSWLSCDACFTHVMRVVAQRRRRS